MPRKRIFCWKSWALHRAHQAAGRERCTGGVGEPVYPARRWKVERSISWLNNMRKLRVRWEKKVENYRGLWMLAAALITYRHIILG